MAEEGNQRDGRPRPVLARHGRSRHAVVRQTVARHAWIIIALIYSALVIVADISVARHQSVTGLLALTPVLVSFEWGWKRTALWSVVPLVLAGTGLFGYDQTATHVVVTRLLAVALGTALGVYGAMDSERRQAKLLATSERAVAEREGREAAELSERRHAAAAAFAEAVRVDEVTAAIFDHVVRELGGRSVSLWFLDEEEGSIRFVSGAGHPPGGPEMVGAVPVDGDLPVAFAVRTGEPVLYGSTRERDDRWPALRALATGAQAAAVLRLAARGRVLGCLSIGFSEERAFSRAAILGLSAAADQCALALDRALLFDAERHAHETLELLAEGTAVLVSALEPDDVLRRLVHLAVPRLADWCAVYVAEEGMFRRVAAAAKGHPEVEKLLVGGDLIALGPETTLVVAYRTGAIQVISNVRNATLAAGYPPLARDLLASLGLTRGVAVPIQAAGETIGAMALGFAESGPAPDLFTLTGLADRAGIALDNARRFRRQTEVAETLTAALLPSRLPLVPTMSFAARYIPASGGVCGDWYEVERLPDGAILVGLGDASGHGLPAASAMAELRNAARGLAVAGMPPAEVLRHLSALVVAGDPNRIATALYMRLDPTTGTGRWASAGHVPPLLVRPGAPADLLGGPSLPLGVAVDVCYQEMSIALEAGATLVAVSDGVVERRGEVLDEGLHRLRAIVERLAGETPDAIADRIAEEFCVDPRDDCCVLIVRYGGDLVSAS